MPDQANLLNPSHAAAHVARLVAPVLAGALLAACAATPMQHPNTGSPSSTTASTAERTKATAETAVTTAVTTSTTAAAKEPGPPAGSTPKMSTLDLQALWNFADPASSEQRFQNALTTAQGDDTLILHTQIARTHTLRRNFALAREQLAALQPQLATAGAEARVRHALEWGRCFASGTHRPEELTEDARNQARQAWQRALDTARAAGLDALAVDAIHMFAFIDTTPAQQQHWAEEALALVLASSQPAAQRWQASIRNNLGYALEQQGRHGDALPQYQRALALRRQMGNAQNTLVSGYMVARSLRLLGRGSEALAMQQQLLRDSEALGAADPYVLDELALLYKASGDTAQAEAAAQRATQLRSKSQPQ